MCPFYLIDLRIPLKFLSILVNLDMSDPYFFRKVSLDDVLLWRVDVPVSLNRYILYVSRVFYAF